MDELEGRLRSINSLAEMTRATRSSVPLDYVLGIGGFDLDKVDEVVSWGSEFDWALTGGWLDFRTGFLQALTDSSAA